VLVKSLNMRSEGASHDTMQLGQHQNFPPNTVPYPVNENQTSSRLPLNNALLCPLYRVKECFAARDFFNFHLRVFHEYRQGQHLAPMFE
jgi:hypothetical protein